MYPPALTCGGQPQRMSDGELFTSSEWTASREDAAWGGSVWLKRFVGLLIRLPEVSLEEQADGKLNQDLEELKEEAEEA